MYGGGLNLSAGGQVRLGAPTSFSSAPMAATATEAAFGPGYTQAGSPDAKAALFPNDPFGMAFWLGVAAVAALVFIRYTLPA